MTTMLHPTGKGYFIWNAVRCAGGQPAQAAAMAAQARVNWVALKIHDGTAHFNGSWQTIRGWVQTMTEAGVAVWAWGYNYGRDPRGEANVALDRMKLGGPFAGYLINAEHQYKGQPAAAREWVDAFREQETDMALGLCSYRYPSLHTTFPWAEFLAGCDFHMPQVYWMADNRPDAPAAQLARSVGELRQRRDLPVVPLGVSSPDDHDTWRPTLEQIRNFNTAARTMGLPGVGWWSWEHAERVDPRWWSEIATHEWHVTPPALPARRTKLGPHHLTGGSDTRRWLEEARPTVAKFVGDFGVAQFAPEGTLCVGRMDDAGWRDGQGADINRYARDGESPSGIAAEYANWLDPHITANPRIDVWEFFNEQALETHQDEATDPAIAAEFAARRKASMLWYAEAGYHFAREMKQRGKRAGLGGWSTGNPIREHNLWPHYTVALDAVRDFNAILTRHEYSQIDGFNALRYRWDNEQFTALGYPRLPVIISECGTDDTGGGWLPWRYLYADDAERYWREWVRPYALEIERDDYCLGATLYTVGGHPQFNVDGTSIVEHVIALAGEPVPPVEEELDMTTKTEILAQLGIIETAQAAIDEQSVAITVAADTIKALLEEPPPPPWWDKPVPYAFRAQNNPALKLYLPDRVTVAVRLNYTGWFIDVLETTPDGWLRITGNDLWLRASDVTPI